MLTHGAVPYQKLVGFAEQKDNPRRVGLAKFQLNLAGNLLEGRFFFTGGTNEWGAPRHGA
jgi:hypothetical protein